MPRVLFESTPNDSGQRLQTLKEQELLSFFRSLPWDAFLADHLQELSIDALKVLLQNLSGSLPAKMSSEIVVPIEDADKVEFVEELRVVYLLHAQDNVEAIDIIGDIERAWSAREDDKKVKAIDGLGILCEEVKTTAGRPSRFYTSSSRGSQAVKKLLAFWESCVAENTLNGFLGRFYQDNLKKRRTEFVKIFQKFNFDELDSYDAKELASFLSPEGTPISPSAGSCRRLLSQIALSESPDGGVLAEECTPPPLAVNILREDETPKPDASTPRPPKKDGRPKGKGKQKAPAPAQMADTSSQEVSESDDPSDHTFCSDDSDDDESFAPPRSRKHPKFPGLPRKMVQVLQQGGQEFEDLFEPLPVDVTTPKDLHILLKYFYDGQRVTRELCRASGLTVEPSLCPKKLEKGALRRVRPDHRLADTLSFRPTSHRAPRILHRWMSHGSIMPWLNALCAKAGQIEKDNADGYLAREIMSTGLTLASLLNEFHPAHLLYSSAVERLVRRLWVIEKSLGMERQERGPYVVKMLGFMGIGCGPVVEPEELN